MKIKHFHIGLGVQLFKAFSDESRLRILHLLHHNGEMCITDLEMVLEFSQTKTSRHLIYMKNAGITSSRKSDQWAWYSINDELQDVIGQLFKYMEKDPTLAQDLQHYRIMFSNRELAAARPKPNRVFEQRYAI